MTSIEPLNRGVLLKPDPIDETVRGLAVPETVRDKEEPTSGTIVALSQNAPTDLHVGQHVVFSAWGGVQFTVDGTSCLLMDPAEILGVLR
jgi:co-chaperonin GroES (HSP10)